MPQPEKSWGSGGDRTPRRVLGPGLAIAAQMAGEGGSRRGSAWRGLGGSGPQIRLCCP